MREFAQPYPQNDRMMRRAKTSRQRQQCCCCLVLPQPQAKNGGKWEQRRTDLYSCFFMSLGGFEGTYIALAADAAVPRRCELGYIPLSWCEQWVGQNFFYQICTHANVVTNNVIYSHKNGLCLPKKDRAGVKLMRFFLLLHAITLLFFATAFLS